jgi:hypothetical protein
MIEGDPSKQNKTNPENKTPDTTAFPASKPLPATRKGEDYRQTKTHDWYDYATLLITVLGLYGLFYYAYWAGVQGIAATFALNAAKSEFDLSERPWIYADGDIIAPISRSPDGSSLSTTVEFTIHNLGYSPAIAVSLYIDDPLYSIPITPDLAVKQSKLCDPSARVSGSPIAPEITVFPSQQGRPEDKLIFLSGFMIPKTMDEKSRQGGKPWQTITPAVVGCIHYGFEFDQSPHQTPFIYQIADIVTKRSSLEFWDPFGINPTISTPKMSLDLRELPSALNPN